MSRKKLTVYDYLKCKGNRQLSVLFVHNADEAAAAEEAGIDTRCINFLLLHPELVTQETNARSITTFFNSISSFDSFEKNLSLIQLIGEGSVGDAFASMFTTFINNKLDKLVTPMDLLTHDNQDYILGELKGCIGTDDEYRADIASTLATRLANYAVVYSKEKTVTQKITDRLEAICTKDHFTNDLKYREHVTNYIYDNPFSFRIVNVTSDVEIFNNKNYSVDDEKDLIFIKKLYKRFGEKLFRMNVYEIVNL